MTEADILDRLATLTPAQHRMLYAKVSGDWRGVHGSGRWKTLDALIAKHLLIGTWVTTAGGHVVLDYQPSALVALVVERLRAADGHATPGRRRP